MIKFSSENRTTSDKINIDEFTYNNNLQFYTMLKLLLKCGLSDNQLVVFQDILERNKDINDSEKLASILLQDNAVISDKILKYEDFCYLINTMENCDLKMWISLMDISIELMFVKGLILEESKVYAKNQYRDVIRNIEDKLSLEYDISGLNLPYGQRVISSLLVYTLTNKDREDEFLLETSGKTIKVFNDKIKFIIHNYNINCNNMFSLIMAESMNQSITSDAGQSYESRVNEKINPLVDKMDGHSHDSNISSVEYDFTFEINNKKCGISAKRTLRERYKQNFEDVELLDVDYMFLITLGIDLNEDKLNNILQKHGIYIIVSNEVYESKSYLKNNYRVISSKDVSKKLLMKLTSIRELTDDELKKIIG
ncbi:MAG TPA: hypothetical protein GX708_16330 [Gallicola sp.]|nr:hypothetical protein [Gallicola sp.]